MELVQIQGWARTGRPSRRRNLLLKQCNVYGFGTAPARQDLYAPKLFTFQDELVPPAWLKYLLLPILFTLRRLDADETGLGPDAGQPDRPAVNCMDIQ